MTVTYSQLRQLPFSRAMDFREVYAGLRFVIGNIAIDRPDSYFDEFFDQNCTMCGKNGIELTLWMDDALARFHFYGDVAPNCQHIPRPETEAERRLRNHHSLYIRADYHHDDVSAVESSLDLVTNRIMIWFESLAAGTAA
jgi:hypothetical protein